MADETLARAIRSAVEVQGVPWGGRRRVGSPEWLADGLSAALAHADGMTGRECVAAIIGECAQETDWFCSLVEYGGQNARYAPYFGRGCIQCTWESNYRACGDWAGGLGYGTSGAAMAANPGRMAEMPFAWLSAIWYFAAHIPSHYWESRNWNAISGLINAGNAGYYTSGYELRARSINAALAVLENDGWAYQGEDDMGYVDDISDQAARKIAMATMGGAGAASPMYTDRLDGHQEYPETALFSLRQRIGVMIGELGGRIDGLAAALGQLGAGQNVDVDAVKAAAAAGAKAGVQAVIESAEVTLHAQAPEPEPAAVAAFLAADVHTVAAGETLQDIAAKAGVDMSAIVGANPGLEPNGLVAGQRITIPAKERK